MQAKSTLSNRNLSRDGGAVRRAIVFGAFLMIVSALLLTPFMSMIENVAAGSVAHSVIVQLKDDPAAVWKAKQQKAGKTVTDEQLQAYRGSLSAKQNAFLADLQSRGINAQIDGVDVPNFEGEKQMRADYRFNLVLNGLTLKVPASALNVIRSLPQVKSVKPNETLELLLNKSVPYINAPAVYGQYPELTQFDNFREGYEGQGMNVAVLDTGIDWAHAMFGGDPTPPRLGIAPPTAAVNSNQKVIYYMSFTGGLPDDYGHGSAAASNIAGFLGMAPGPDGLPGTADDIKVHGVAPQAKLMGYKVCLAVGSCVSASTILAIEDAVSPVSLTMQPKPIAHVINMSLGGAGSPDSDTAIAADNASLLGTVVVASAGNSGPGEGTIGAPSAGRHVISVAASTDPAAANQTWSADLLTANAVPSGVVGGVTPANNLPSQPGTNRIRLYKMAESIDPAPMSVAQRYALVDLTAATSTYPASVKGRIALVKESGLVSATFFDICNGAAANGAIGMILVSTTTNPTALKGLIPCSIVSPEDGNKLIDAMSSTDNNDVDPANGTISELPLRLNPYLDNVFVGNTASFSSRGPVAGLGQVKPDVTAPGVAITSATVRVGSADANTGTMFDPTGYTEATGTSFSGPHVAGAVTLIKQAHLDWTPDVVRTALINTSSNLRTSTGAAKPDGETADSVNDQGGGLVNVAAAVRTKAIMGVEGDGITAPGILGSHSFGEKAVLNNRIDNTFTTPVTIRDLSGQGGTYNLSTVNNRSTSMAGASVSVSPSTVSVPAGGSVTVNASITIDGNVIRDTDTRQFQWYVTAEGAGQKLRMPFYLQATASLPSDQIGSSETATYTGTVIASDGGVQRDNELYLLGGVTYTDVPFEVSSSTLKLDATLTWDITDTGAGVGLPDLDFLLFDPNGSQIGDSGNSNAPEHIAVNTTIPGTYVYRVYGWANGPTDFQIASTQLKGGAAPVVKPFAADLTLGEDKYDFDGNVTLSWEPSAGVDAYEIEHSTDGNNWQVLGTAPASASSQAIGNVADGKHSYRIRSITPGRVGKFVTLPSNVESIIVSRRSEVDATDAIAALNRSITFPAGATELVTALKNNSTTTYYPNLRFEIVSVSSSGNSVKVANADNGGDGIATPGVFDYSQLVGTDFVAGEESGNKTIRFSNPNTVLFTFTAKVKAHIGGAGAGTTAGATSTDGSTGGTNTSGGTGLNSLSGKLLKFTVNPLTKGVTVQLL